MGDDADGSSHSQSVCKSCSCRLGSLECHADAAVCCRAAAGTTFLIAEIRQRSGVRAATIAVHVRRTPVADGTPYEPSAIATSGVTNLTDSTSAPLVNSAWRAAASRRSRAAMHFGTRCRTPTSSPRCAARGAIFFRPPPGCHFL